MAKLSVSVDVPLPPEQAWAAASDLPRFKDWLTIHRVWRSTLPETLEKGTTIESIVEVGGAGRVVGCGHGILSVGDARSCHPERLHANNYSFCCRCCTQSKG